MIVAHRAKGAGVHGAVTQKFVDCAVVLAGARMGDDVDLAAASSAHVRRVAAGFHLEFLYGIGRGAQVLCIEGGIRVGRAVEEEKISVWPAAADHDCGALSGTPVEWIGRSRLGAKTYVRARHSEDEINQHSPVERQFADRLGLDEI